MSAADGRTGRTRAAVLIAVSLCASLVLYTVPGQREVAGESAAHCVDETAELAAMSWIEVTVTPAEQDASAAFRARLAATASQRSAGMQYLCPDAIAANPILFVFPEPARPAFHMRNVHAPLDIVFINDDGAIISIDRMEPEQQTLTRPKQPVRAALELWAGGAGAKGLAVGHEIRW